MNLPQLVSPTIKKNSWLIALFALGMLSCELSSESQVSPSQQVDSLLARADHLGSSPKPTKTVPKERPKRKEKRKNKKESQTLVANLVCSGNELNLLPKIRHYADSITALNLPYNQATANDCSGTFIRLNQYLNSFCQELNLPSFKQVRSTRDLVKYYHQRDQLIFVQDPLNADHLIQPGVVMFYTHGGRGGQLEVNANNMQSLVNHVGIVYSVERDANTGKVIKYSLFHGRNPKRGINITYNHQRKPLGKSLKAYPYGNGPEQWMAMAPLL